MISSGSFSGTITSEGCDWGTSVGGDDNAPDDIGLLTILETFNYDDDATFTCTAEGCE